MAGVWLMQILEATGGSCRNCKEAAIYNVQFRNHIIDTLLRPGIELISRVEMR